MLLLNPIENDFAILFRMAMENQSLGLFMAGPKNVSEMVHISQAEIAEENNVTTSFGEKGLFSCRHIYLCRWLLPQINSCCQVVMQNNEMTSPGPTTVGSL